MIKDVLVHLDGSPHDEERLLEAEAIASIGSAHLTGLFTNALPDFATLVPLDGGALAAEMITSLDIDARREGAVIEARLNERLARMAGPNDVRRIDEVDARLPSCAATEGRWADLFVLSRPTGDADVARWKALFEAVLFESGRAVVVVPPGYRAPDAIRRVLVCWRDTRESARAVAAATPILAQATRTTVLIIDPRPLLTGEIGEPAADIAAHLDRHGAKVDVNVVTSGDRDVSEVILEQAKRLSADLIVMGAYGHSRSREWLMGGATRDLLETSPIPLLMAH
ncbi:universal stress protein [Microvirga antarctica]|uniref:universal stress protein n=1 Tax=Microvirga antarctica TaxID=2819233 RepID=UPI001B303216|nr:universal stress protein [Microvirga antarctica]